MTIYATLYLHPEVLMMLEAKQNSAHTKDASIS